jgi:hypothetical protein
MGNPIEAKWSQRDPAAMVHRAVTREVVQTAMTMTDPQIRINAITVTRIVKDTIKEYRNAYARMRSYEIMAERDGFSASEFTLFPTRFLEKSERAIIHNEMENDIRRKSWLNEARAQVIQHRQQQDEPYDLTQQNEWRPNFTSEQQRPATEPTREMPSDWNTFQFIRKRTQHGTSIYYTRLSSRAKKLASEDMATFAFCNANSALRDLQSGTAGKEALTKFQHSQRIIELAEELLHRTQIAIDVPDPEFPHCCCRNEVWVCYRDESLQQQLEEEYLLLLRRADLKQQLETAEGQLSDLQQQVTTDKENKRKLQQASADQTENPLKRSYRALVPTLKGIAQEIAIQLDDQHQDKVKRQTAGNLKRSKKINAIIQDENKEYMCHGTESDEENEHEREQEESNSEDGHALASEQEKQSRAVIACGLMTSGWT